MIRQFISAAVALAVALCAHAASFDIDCAVDGAHVSAPSSLAVGDTIAVRAPGGASFALRLVSAPPAGVAGQSYIARDDGGSASAVVKLSAGGLRVSIDDFANHRAITVLVKDGRASCTSRDTTPEGGDACGTCGGELPAPAEQAVLSSAKPALKSARLAALQGDFTFAGHKSIVDILVVFDKGAVEKVAAKSAEWGCASIDDFAEYAVAKMNMVLANSQLDAQFAYRLAGVATVDGRWSAINNDLLLALRAREGAFATISQLREKHGADTVTLLIDRTSGNTSGIGFEYSSAYTAPAQFDGMNYACNVCDINTVYSRYTMSHETGHNMGCGHSNRQGSNSGPGRYSDSCGYHFADTNGVRRYTIMGYSYTSDDSYSYDPVPYFSAPDISPAEYGCALGVSGVNNNRGTLAQTHADIAGLREHVLPYEWDVRFLDDSGNDIADGSYFYLSCEVTLTNSNPNAEIYYTQDGSPPTSSSSHCGPGGKITVYLYSPKTITACAVTNGIAISTRSISLRDGLAWSGDANGNGLWTNSDSSVKPWGGNYFYDDPVMFPDLAGVSCATVSVATNVSPASVAFTACETRYVFAKGGDNAQINIPDAAFVPSGDVTFNVPVKMNAGVFTNFTGHAITFNAPFGQTVDSSGGNFSGMVNIGPYGTLTVAPGAGKTQTLEKLNNVGWYAGSSTFRVGGGTVVFNGEINRGAGVTGRTKLEVGNGGSLVFNQGGATGYDMDQTSLTVEKGGSVRFNNMEHLMRTLYLDGGTVYANRFDLVSNPGVYVTDDSAIENNGDGYILIRNSDSVINVSAGKALTLGVGSETKGRDDTAGWGIIKRGGGTIVANVELKHSGVTDIEEGTVEVGYSSGSTAYGQGWIVASNSTLRVKGGCSLRVPTLTLDGAAVLALPAAEAAPLVVANAVDLPDVAIELDGLSDPKAGDVYPLVRSDAALTVSGDVRPDRLPTLAKGLKWKLEVEGNVLCAKVLERSPAEMAVEFFSNDASLSLAAPDDAVANEGGGATIAARPYVVEGLATKAVSIAVRFTVPESSPASAAAICSWKLGDNAIHCMRAANGNFYCYWNDLRTVDNATNTVALTAGDHLLQIAYYSESTSKGGTRVWLDGNVAYFATGLKFSSSSVSRVAFGATAEDSPRYPYAGLVVRETAVLDVLSPEPAPRMTASGGDIEYAFHFPDEIPRVFPLTPGGAIAMKESLAAASFAGTYDALAVSVVAAFPSAATGTIFGAAVDAGLSNPYSTQVEYRGDGVLAFRDNGNNGLAASVHVDADVSAPHLYTLTYRKGDGYRLFLDGAEVLSNDGYYRNKNFPAAARVSFGCGYWSKWLENWNDNPNPMPDLELYASHIALGTDDRAVSESAVNESTGGDPEEPDPHEKPADRFDVPGTDAYIARSDALEEWLEEANFELYELGGGTWQEFMEEIGENGYVNWMNYVLGLPAADPLAKVKATISFDAEGRVVVSVADSIPYAPTVSGLKVVSTLLETSDLKSWPDTGVSADGKVVVVTRTHGGRFYRVEVSVASQ